MQRQAIRVLFVDDEIDFLEVTSELLRMNGFEVVECSSVPLAEDALKARPFDVVVCDIRIADRDGLQFYREYSRSHDDLIPWIFISGDRSPELVQKVSMLGAIDIILKPFSSEQLTSHIRRAIAKSNDPVLEILDIVRGVSGMNLGDEKRLLVETRLMRRARVVGLGSVEEYFGYFKENRDSEVAEIISLITTHTTEFFREKAHFDFLAERVLPELLSEGRPTMRVWSAACSTGEEVYSLGITILEAFAEAAVKGTKIPKLELFGTDIDVKSVEKSINGVYPLEALKKSDEKLKTKYFDIGVRELKGFVRVKDSLADMCRFAQYNLLSKSKESVKFDVIFLRNVLIYFKPADVERIITTITEHLVPGGVLFLGHSESIGQMKSPLKVIGNSIYEMPNPKQKVAVLQPRLPADAKIRVFIIDDSQTIRALLRSILTNKHGFEVVGEAENPVAAQALLPGLKVDLITLDVHMPVMDGITYLESLQGKAHPPIVVISSINYEDAVGLFRCLELGAIDFIEKPSHLNMTQDAEKIRVILTAAARIKTSPKKKTADTVPIIKQSAEPYRRHPGDLIAIGSSTGGIEAIDVVISQMPVDCPPILIAQHIPANFSGSLAARFDAKFGVNVREGADGEEVKSGTVYIAPGGKQMKVVERGRSLHISITDDPPVNRHRPSVDYLFDSIAAVSRRYNVCAALLTGMGEDGARGLKGLRDAGAHTIAQNEESCIVYGMPRAAVKFGAAIEVIPLQSIGYHLLRGLKRRQAA